MNKEIVIYNKMPYLIRSFVLIIYRTDKHKGFGPHPIRIAEQDLGRALAEDHQARGMINQINFMTQHKIFCFMERSELLRPAKNIDLSKQGINHYTLFDLNPTDNDDELSTNQ